MELVDMRDLGSRAFSVWVRVPSGAPAQEFPLPLRFPPFGAESSAGRGIPSLSPAIRSAGFAGDFLRGTGDGRRGDTGRWNYKKLGGEFKIAHMFDYVKGDFTRFL